jgi:hypothetical protein
MKAAPRSIAVFSPNSFEPSTERPKAIGLDLIFDRKSSQDAALVAAIRTAKAPVVLGAIDERIPNLPPQSLAIRMAPEINGPSGRPSPLERKEGLLARSDSTVRLIGAPYESRLATTLRRCWRAASATHEPENRIILATVPSGEHAAFHDDRRSSAPWKQSRRKQFVSR